MPMKLVTVAEMQSIEKEANSLGLSFELMMERAGRGLAGTILEVYGYLEEDGICGLIGSGNNGGDALVALAELAEQGWPAYAYLVRPRNADDPLIERFINKGGLIYHSWEDPRYEHLKALLAENSVILDGVLGTGARLPLKPEIAEILEMTQSILSVMESPPVVVAVDCPSGVDCDTGEAAEQTIPADLTVTMAAVKQGLFRFPANKLVGELNVVGIGLQDFETELPAWKAVQTIVPDSDWVKNKLPLRPANAHKGDFGTALVIAGSLNYTGAAWLAGQAAYRIGAGLVTLAIPESLHAALAGQFPEATWLLLPEENGFIDRDAAAIIYDNLERVTAMLVGPGFGLQDATGEFLERLLKTQHQRPMGFIGGVTQHGDLGREQQPEHLALPGLVIDADGLKLLGRVKDWPGKLPAMSVLTPHPGEMSILTGLTKDTIQSDRIEIAKRFSRAWQHVVILKGAFTVIASPDGQTAIIPVATPALARAGTGDVLAGLVVGLRAQGVEAYPAAVAGAWIHAQAGWRAAEKLGNSASVLAGDVLQAIIQVISEELV